MSDKSQSQSLVLTEINLVSPADYDDIKNDTKRMDHIEALIGVLRDFLGHEVLPNDVEMIRTYGRVVVNSFNILDTDQNTIGTGIYLGVSVTDHSCRPNAVVTFDGLDLNMRSIAPMRRIDFSKIFITYIDLMDAAEQRRKALAQTYYFRCECTRCVDAVEDLEMHAAACPNAECRAPLDLRPAILPVRRCGCCQAIVLEQHVANFRSVMELTRSGVEKMQSMSVACEYMNMAI